MLIQDLAPDDILVRITGRSRIALPFVNDDGFALDRVADILPGKDLLHGLVQSLSFDIDPRAEVQVRSFEDK